MSASSLRSVPEADFPIDGPPRLKLGYALKYAMLAPTEIDWQPWGFRVTDAHIELLARNEPDFDAIDPDGRELMIGCGAALLYLKLALKHFGCLGPVELFPHLGEPNLVARIHFGAGREREAQDNLLFAAMTRRRGQPRPPEESPVSEPALATLRHAVAGERGWVEFARSAISRQRLMELAAANERRRIATESPRDSIALPATRWTKPRHALSVRRSEVESVSIQPKVQPEVPTATLAVVKTKTDDKRGWLAAGHAMAHVILQAQAMGLSWSFFNEAVRRRDAREALRTGIGHKGFAQVILRFGPLTTNETFRPAAAATSTATLR